MSATPKSTYVLSEAIGTFGGPHIIVPSALLPDWFGVFKAPTPREAKFRFNDPKDPATDYDRACDIEDHLGAIPLGQGTALVLGAELVDISIATVESGSVLILRPILGEDANIVEAIAYSFGDDIREQIEEYVPTSPEHVLFDSACLGTDIPGINYPETESERSLVFELTASRYVINTYIYKPRDLVYVVTHRFIPAEN